MAAAQKNSPQVLLHLEQQQTEQRNRLRHLDYVVANVRALDIWDDVKGEYESVLQEQDSMVRNGIWDRDDNMIQDS